MLSAAVPSFSVIEALRVRRTMEPLLVVTRSLRLEETGAMVVLAATRLISTVTSSTRRASVSVR